MKHVPGLLLSLGIAWAPGLVQAQDAWPARPITFVVPYGAGGYTDLVARLTGRYVEKALGKPVIVDNRAGAGGFVGTQAVVNAAADGYTFCVCSIGAISIAPFDPNQKVSYEPLRDLAPVGVPLLIYRFQQKASHQRDIIQVEWATLRRHRRIHR